LGVAPELAAVQAPEVEQVPEPRGRALVEDPAQAQDSEAAAAPVQARAQVEPAVAGPEGHRLENG